MKLLLDTNVLLDYYLRRKPFFEDSLTLRIAQYFGDVELWVCAQSFADAEYVMRKIAPRPTVREIMATSLEFFYPCSTVAEDVLPGINSDWNELEDYLIARAAQRIEADFLVTRNITDFKNSSVPPITPQDVIMYLKEEHHLEYAPLFG